MNSASQRQHPVGRGAKVRRAVLAATVAELVDVGYAALTIDNVAQRAGVHKTTVYRRWYDRHQLVTDAVLDLSADSLDIPATGDIDVDLQAFVRSLAHWLSGPVGQSALAILMSDAARLPEISAARKRFFRDRMQRAKPVIDAAIDRGQLPSGTDSDALIKTLIAPIYLRLLVTDEPVTAADADRATRIALGAARAGLLMAPDDTRPGRTPGDGKDARDAASFR
jgi:AcrR family transcriptional regulator